MRLDRDISAQALGAHLPRVSKPPNYRAATTASAIAPHKVEDSPREDAPLIAIVGALVSGVGAGVVGPVGAALGDEVGLVLGV